MSSYWINSVPDILKKHESVKNDLSCDVAIIGGGLTGLSCGYYLSKKGLNTIVLEKDYLMSKTSGNTTGKVTSQHGLFYDYLIKNFGFNTAKKYLHANENSISEIKRIIDNENINCDFNFVDSYVFTKSHNYVQAINDEVRATQSLGLDSRFVNKIPLPTNNVLCGIKFPHQAQFHPRKYAVGLVNSIKKNQGLIFEKSKVTNIEKRNGFYSLEVNEHEIHATNVILACRYPFINTPGFYFLKMYQSMDYCMCLDFDGIPFDGIYINAESPTLSARIIETDTKPLLLVVGCSHRVGKPSGVSNPYSTLETFAHSIYHNSNPVLKWSTEDSVSLDKLPYIGQFSALMPNMYIATGFKKWGMTFSNISANIITDKILNRENIYSDIFDSTRLHPIQNKEEMGNMIKETTKSLIIKKITVSNDALETLTFGEGKIIEIDGEKVGIYKDSNGKTYKVKPICTHLGCNLSWNPVNKTWDCPCHGSRYNFDGKLLYGPGLKDLEVF